MFATFGRSTYNAGESLSKDLVMSNYQFDPDRVAPSLEAYLARDRLLYIAFNEEAY